MYRERNDAKMDTQIIKIWPRPLPKSIQNLPKWCPGAFRKRFWEQVGSKMSRPSTFRHLLTSLGRFGMPFGTKLCAKGVPQIEHFGTRMLQNVSKIGPREGARKKHDLLMRFWLKHVRFGRFWTLPGALYTSISVVLAEYGKISNPIKNQTPKRPKINTIGVTGSHFWSPRG